MKGTCVGGRLDGEEVEVERVAPFMQRSFMVEPYGDLVTEIYAWVGETWVFREERTYEEGDITC